MYAYHFAVSDTCYQYVSWRALAALQKIDPLVFQLSTVCAERNDFWSNNVFKLHWNSGRLAKKQVWESFIGQPGSNADFYATAYGRLIRFQCVLKWKRRLLRNIFANPFCLFCKGTINGCGAHLIPILNGTAVSFCNAPPALNMPRDCFAYPCLSQESIGSQIAWCIIGRQVVQVR